MLYRGGALSQVDDYNEASTRLKECGIINCRRHILIFRDPESTNQIVNSDKAAVINHCIYKGDNSAQCIAFGQLANNYKGSLIVRTATYFGNIVYAVPGDIRSAEFVTESATTKESCIYNGLIIPFTPDLYHKVMKRMDSDLVADIRNGKDTTNLSPLYYNEMHMWKEYGELVGFAEYGVGDEGPTRVNLRDLMTPESEIKCLNINYWDCMRLSEARALTDVESKIPDSFEIPRYLLPEFSSSYLGLDSVFIYDSDGNGPNSRGIAVKGGYVPNGNVIGQKQLVDNLSTALQLFELNCRDLESNYGHVRVLFSPNNIGSRVRIEYKDYNEESAPSKPLSKILPKTGTLRCATTLDSNYVIQKDIEETYSDVVTAEQDAFGANIKGYR